MSCNPRYPNMMDTFSKESLLFLAHLSKRCSKWAIVISLCVASVVCRQQFLQMTSSLKPLSQFQNNFAQMFLLCPFTKIAQMVLLHWTRWPSELKIEKSSNDISSYAICQISKCLHRSVPQMALYQNCLNGSAQQNKMATRAKNRKTFKRHLLRCQWLNFKVISQKCSSYGPLPELLEWFV